MKLLKGFCISLLLLTLACSQDDGTKGLSEGNFLLSTETDGSRSTELGNFVATAVLETYEVDFAFIPAPYFRNKDIFINVGNRMSAFEQEYLLSHFPKDPQDQLLLGAMKGKDIKEFIIQRASESYNVDLEVAGIWYDITFVGGVVDSALFSIQGRRPVEDDQIYRIAISDDFYFGSAFPGYKYRNNFNFRFDRQRIQRSIREAIASYISKDHKQIIDWKTIRARVNNHTKPHLGFQAIHDIQGPGHSSPLRAHTVITKGIVTAVGTDNWYPYDLDIYIQSQTPDGDIRTSEGLHITSTFNNVPIKIGQLIEVEGVVMEEMRTNGMGETTLRLTKAPRILEDSVPLPEPRFLDNIPTERISHFDGPLMLKKSLDIARDGIDYWESVESMRVETRHLVVSGFRGGGEDLLPISDRFYLNLYVYSKESYSQDLLTYRGGLRPNLIKNDHNPELFVITTNHLSRGIEVQKSNGDYYYYNVGDEIAHEDLPAERQSLIGVMTYQKNLFGGGEYALVVPEPQESLKYRNIKSKGLVPTEERPTTKFESLADNEITVATLNVENLPGNRQDRIDKLGEIIAENLNCPDLMNLVEVQDDNGFSLRFGVGAELTLKKVKLAVQQVCPKSHYEYINIDPFEQSEGGQPGGNIRVALLYNKKKLNFTYRGDHDIALGGHTGVLKGGNLSLNPGRVFPLDPAFENSRRSPVMQFTLVNQPAESVYLIGAHLNSKLGDIDFWGSQQPAVTLSDDRRSLMTEKLNQFVRWIESENPRAHIFVLGDFNALSEEGSMKILTGQGEQLRNGIFTLPENERYTTNHNGNSQPLDYIFMNRNIYQKGCTDVEILHINSDFMGRISDHDPVILKTCF